MLTYSGMPEWLSYTMFGLRCKCSIVKGFNKNLFRISVMESRNKHTKQTLI